ncbi:hypothetical protein C5Y96_13555 [Blastopirellula marina]|uniref:Uncharacterized protein n=1 Tax=Blastopirellula marina TaxID=124 RepID=A0A2S8FGR1_9BACT|nr:MULTISPECIES: hypothetical protein [Pirellulaceae]PQO31361.1 hypothetical protein C5Y96_13555 [Blastopirellula marina]RCS51755.1 hypothetical protein DTL36_13565 [Bremerella cremea]
MAKKKAKSAAADANKRVPRKEPYDSDRMSNVVERLREQAGRISQLARTLDDADIDEVVIDGHAMLLRGLNQIDNFADNAARAVREARTMKFG